MKSVKSTILIGSLVIVGIVLLTISSRSQDTAPIVTSTASGAIASPTSALIFPTPNKNGRPSSKELNPKAIQQASKVTPPPTTNTVYKISYTKLELPDGTIVPVPKELNQSSPTQSKIIELEGHRYKQTFLSFELGQLKPKEKHQSNIPFAIDFFFFSPALTPDLFYQNTHNYCGVIKQRVQERIRDVTVEMIKFEDCPSYSFWLNLKSKTVFLVSHINEPMEQINYTKALIAEFIKLNQQQGADNAG